jgi:outer membrane protein OmpA-like peptidoglycan-associated protein
LLELGIETHKISYEGRGEEEPIADNDSEIGRAMNRRTEFYIIKP